MTLAEELRALADRINRPITLHVCPARGEPHSSREAGFHSRLVGDLFALAARAEREQSLEREELIWLPIERCGCGKCQTGHLVFDDEMHGFLGRSWMLALGCGDLKPGERKVVTLRAMFAAEEKR